MCLPPLSMLLLPRGHLAKFGDFFLIEVTAEEDVFLASSG